MNTELSGWARLANVVHRADEPCPVFMDSRAWPTAVRL